MEIAKQILRVLAFVVLAVVLLALLIVAALAFIFLLSPQQCTFVAFITIFALIKEENRLTRKKIDENIRVSQKVHNKLSNIGL